VRGQRKLSAEPSTYHTDNGSLYDKRGGGDYLDSREKVLLEKEKKKREAQEKVEKALQDIRRDNVETRRTANEKKYSQYRPSDDIVSLIPLGEKKSSATNFHTQPDQFETLPDLPVEPKSSDKSKKQFKITEDYEMNDEDGSDSEEIIQEVENEEEDGDELHKIEEKITMVMDKLNEKTMKISELKQSLRHTRILEKSIIRKTQTMVPLDPAISDEYQEEDEESLDIEFSENEEDSTEETICPYNEEDIPEKKSYNPQYFKIQDRIKLLRHRCEAGLGFVLFDKSYKFVQDKMNVTKPDDMRKYLIDILGEENIGFWHLIDQILLLEDFSKKLQDC